MGFFTKPEEAAGALAPLSQDRVKATLDKRSMNYGTDSDGDIGGYWGDHLFFFLIMGNDKEILQVRARWNREASVDQVPRIQELINDWCFNKIWPKVFVRVDEGRVHVNTELAVDYEHGVSDDQIDQHLACGIQTALQFFDTLDEEFPELVAAYKAKEAENQAQ